METEIRSLPLPRNADVEVRIRIRAPLPVTPQSARQKVNRQLALHCGQSFVVEEAELEVGEAVVWRVPVWVTHPDRGKVAAVGDVRVDAQTGEVLCSPEQLRLLGAAANGILIDATLEAPARPAEVL